jgi:hypothetical protein
VRPDDPIRPRNRSALDAPSWPDRFVRSEDDPASAENGFDPAHLVWAAWAGALGGLLVLLAGSLFVIVELLVLRSLSG